VRSHRAVRGPALSEAWEAEFEARLRGGDVLGASDILRTTGTNGWVRKAEHDRAAAIIDRFAPAPLVRREWALRLIAHPRRVDKELAVALLLPIARTHPRDIERAIVRLKDEKDPAVRRALVRLERALAASRTQAG
jgi:N-acyl-L-homoserine lactone synthetase